MTNKLSKKRLLSYLKFAADKKNASYMLTLPALLGLSDISCYLHLVCYIEQYW